MKSKQIWPYPSKSDGPGWEERQAIAKINRYKIWGTNRKPSNNKWDMEHGKRKFRIKYLIRFLNRPNN